MVISHVGSLVSHRVAELTSHPGSGMESGRMMGKSANLSISSLIKLVRTSFL